MSKHTSKAGPAVTVTANMDSDGWRCTPVHRVGASDGDIPHDRLLRVNQAVAIVQGVGAINISLIVSNLRPPMDGTTGPQRIGFAHCR